MEIAVGARNRSISMYIFISGEEKEIQNEVLFLSGKVYFLLVPTNTLPLKNVKKHGYLDTVHFV